MNNEPEFTEMIIEAYKGRSYIPMFFDAAVKWQIVKNLHAFVKITTISCHITNIYRYMLCAYD